MIKWLKSKFKPVIENTNISVQEEPIFELTEPAISLMNCIRNDPSRWKIGIHSFSIDTKQSYSSTHISLYFNITDKINNNVFKISVKNIVLSCHVYSMYLENPSLLILRRCTVQELYYLSFETGSLELPELFLGYGDVYFHAEHSIFNDYEESYISKEFLNLIKEQYYSKLKRIIYKKVEKLYNKELESKQRIAKVRQEYKQKLIGDYL